VDTTLKGLLALVEGVDVEARCAALVVLTRLRLAEDKVVRTVGDSLGARNVVVRDFAVGYFEHVRPRDAVGHLVPLLDSQEDGLRHRIVNILAEYGQIAVAAVKKLTKKAPRRRLNAVIDLCARVRSSNALDLLFGFIAGEDLDVSRTACDALVATVPLLDSRARSDLFVRSERLTSHAKGERPALVGAAKVFGALADGRARKHLLCLLSKDQPQVVRTHALGALVQCLRGERLAAAEIRTLLPLLREDDESGILRPAIQLLEDQAFDRSYLPDLSRLAESPQAIVKRFAIHQLGSFDSIPVVRTLIGYLTDDSYARRDEAMASLKKLPAARAALMKEFLACDDERKAWTLADILLLHERNWKRDTLEALWTKLEVTLEKREDRLYTAYFQFLGALDAETPAERVRARADRLRKGRHFALVTKWLSLLKDSPAFDVETKFALAIAELKSHPHTLAAPVRRHDTALEWLRELARSAFPTAERLRKERALTPEDVFYVAFNFAEGREEERAVARELLQHLSGKHGRTKVGKAAKNKLRLLPAA
jgi:HEAT repeat protein